MCLDQRTAHEPPTTSSRGRKLKATPRISRPSQFLRHDPGISLYDTPVRAGHTSRSGVEMLTKMILLGCALAPALASATDWPQFRGSDQNGVLPENDHAPLQWSA